MEKSCTNPKDPDMDVPKIGVPKMDGLYWFQSKETWYTSRICAESSVKSWAPFSFWALKVAIEYQGSDMR